MNNKPDILQLIAMQQLMEPRRGQFDIPETYRQPYAEQALPYWPGYDQNIINQFLQQRTDPIPWLPTWFTGREPYKLGA
jgi:hypothetical protein